MAEQRPCEFAVGKVRLNDILDQIKRVGDAYFVLCGNSVDSGKEAGSGDNEIVIVPKPGAGTDTATIATIKALGDFKGWRCVLMPTYCCIIDESDTGGFSAYLYYADGTRHPDLLVWASEVHYVYASACLLQDRSDEHHLAYIRQFSLNSGSLLSRSPDVVRALARDGHAVASQPDGRLVGFGHPANFKTDLEGPHLDAAIFRAKLERYSQDPHSRAVLLATGRATLTAVMDNQSGDVSIQIGTMVVRTFLQKEESDPNTARDFEDFKMMYDAAVRPRVV